MLNFGGVLQSCCFFLEHTVEKVIICKIQDPFKKERIEDCKSLEARCNKNMSTVFALQLRYVEIAYQNIIVFRQRAWIIRDSWIHLGVVDNRIWDPVARNAEQNWRGLAGEATDCVKAKRCARITNQWPAFFCDFTKASKQHSTVPSHLSLHTLCHQSTMEGWYSSLLCIYWCKNLSSHQLSL